MRVEKKHSFIRGMAFSGAKKLANIAIGACLLYVVALGVLFAYVPRKHRAVRNHLSWARKLTKLVAEKVTK